jgi:hypothetical protein
MSKWSMKPQYFLAILLTVAALMGEGAPASAPSSSLLGRW